MIQPSALIKLNYGEWKAAAFPRSRFHCGLSPAALSGDSSDGIHPVCCASIRGGLFRSFLIHHNVMSGAGMGGSFRGWGYMIMAIVMNMP
jgi:hypothetical protein